MELSSPKIKKFLLLYNHNLKSFSLKNFLYFFQKKTCSEKFFYISGNGTLLPQAYKTLLFQEGTCKA